MLEICKEVKRIRKENQPEEDVDRKNCQADLARQDKIISDKGQQKGYPRQYYVTD